VENEEKFTLRHNFINTPQTSAVFKRLGEVHQEALFSKSSKGLMILGLSGSGKTTTVREYLSLAFPTIRCEGKFNRAIRVEIPSAPSGKNLAAAVLAALGDPFSSSNHHSAEVKFKRVVTLLINLQTEIIIFDEAQHLVDYRRRSDYEAADWIKSLMNEVGITVVLVGLKRTENLILANEQLRRRFSASVDLDRFKCDTKRGQREFVDLIRSIRGILPVPAIELITDDMLRRLHHGSFGLIDYLIKIIDRSVWLARRHPTDGINREVMATAFQDEVWAGGANNRNPFADEFNFIPLIGAREPFENFDGSEMLKQYPFSKES
jgi:DNA transposition AAA+ family ATPase